MKRIVALFSIVLMVLFAVPALARAEETTTLTVTADKTVANPGDRITFSLTLGAVNNLGGMSLYIDLPEGMSIDYSSVMLPEGVKDTLDVDGEVSIPTELNENIFDYSAKRTGYTGTADLCILKFTCTVDGSSALETKSVGLRGVDVFDNDPALNTIVTTVKEAQVRIEEAKATETPAPTAQPTAEPTAEPTAQPTAEPTAQPTAEPTATPEASRYYLADLEDLIEEVEAGTTIRIFKKHDINALNRNILRRLNERGVSLEMEYTYEGKDYKIFIPAGEAVIDDDVFYCGPLYLAGLYGNNSMSSGLEGSLNQVVQGVGQALKQVVDLYP